MKRRVGVGEDLDAVVKVVEAERALNVEQTRSRIVLALMLLAAFFLLGAATIGAYEGDFGKLQTVWNVIAAPSGAVFWWYFGKENSQIDSKEEAK